MVPSHLQGNKRETSSNQGNQGGVVVSGPRIEGTLIGRNERGALRHPRVKGERRLDCGLGRVFEMGRRNALRLLRPTGRSQGSDRAPSPPLARRRLGERFVGKAVLRLHEAAYEAAQEP